MSNQPSAEKQLKTAELSIGRDPDGEVNLEVFIDAKNQVSMSISAGGRISWAAQMVGYSSSGVMESVLGNILHYLIDQCVDKDTEGRT